ncbi:MAG TPA: hypothetical protein PLM75_02060, partial [bacterium]|nr:hypothetical protein [bacterium]
MLKGLVLKKYFIITMLAFIIIFFRQRSYAVDNVYVDDYLSAEAPISAALLGLCNADLHDTKLPVSVIYNPSLLSNLLSPNVSLSKSDLPLKAQYNSLYYSQPFLNGGLGLAYNTLTLDDELFVQTNDAGFIINNGYKVSYSALSLAYARKFEIFKKMFDVGLSLRQLNLAVANTSYSAISPILACLYTFKNTNITLSHSITNFIGGTIGDDKLPMRLKTSANINILKNLKIIPEFEKVDARMDYRLGIKYSPIKLVNIYSGYQPSKISLGFEILYSDWAINYAYQTNSNYFAEKNISSMGVTWNIGYNRKLRMNIYRSEMQNIRKLVDRDENYDSAIVILNNLKKVLYFKSDVDEYDNVVYR